MRRLNYSTTTQLLSQLAILLTSGIDLLRALTLITNEQRNCDARWILQSIHHQIRQGNTFTHALKQHPRSFNHLLINLIEAGENTGKLDSVLHAINEQRSRTHQLRQEIQKALIYPLILIVTTLTILSMLMIFVVPQFQNFYASFNHSLPLLTQSLIQVSVFIQSYGIAILFILTIFIIVFFILYQRWNFFAYECDHLLLKTPVIGSLLIKRLCIQNYMILSLYLNAGLLITTAIHASSHACQNRLWREQLQWVHSKVKAGHTFKQSLTHLTLMPYTDKQLIAMGEESGTLSMLLTRLTQQHQDHLTTQLQQLNTLIEPIILVIIGSGIGVILLAIYLPLFRMGTLF